MSIVFSPHYDITFWGLERVHPFDSRKYGRAWREVCRLQPEAVRRHWIPVDRAASSEELLLAHTPEYLESLRNPAVLAAALELPVLQRLPAWLTQWRIVRPMQWAVRGTILAAEAALRHGWAANMSGGYHHAKPDRGEGFCLFSDIAIAVHSLRKNGQLSPGSRVACIDLDAHQGNGVCHQFYDDNRLFLFDMYNSRIYPGYDLVARERIDCDLPLPANCPGNSYLKILTAHLPGFIEGCSRSSRVDLAIYIAGTDVLQGDPLGGLDLTPDQILQRDLFVVAQFRQRGIPVVMLPSGGYTAESYRLIASTVAEMLKQYGRQGHGA